MKLNEAEIVAVEICHKLQPYCDRINIAGSVRRKKAEVHDIEIVCVPKTQIVYGNQLFGESEEKIIRSNKFIEMVNSLGSIVKGKPSGKMMQIKLPEWIMLDLFIPDDFDYYRQYAIRTGSATYSHKVIASGWLKQGWCGSDKGLRKQSDCVLHKTPDDKNKWICNNAEAELPPVWNSEKEFFDWIQVPFLSPHLRN